MSAIARLNATLAIAATECQRQNAKSAALKRRGNGIPCHFICDAPELFVTRTESAFRFTMLADWVLSAAPGFNGEEENDMEFQALPPRMTAVSASSLHNLRRNQGGTVKLIHTTSTTDSESSVTTL